MLEPESTAVWVGQEWGGGGGIGTHGNKRPKKVALASPYTYVRMMSVYSVGGDIGHFVHDGLYR